MEASTGLSNMTVLSLAVDPSNPETVYAGTGGSGVFRSLNGGASWEAIPTGLAKADVRTLAIHPSNPRVVYSGVFGSAVFAIMLSGPGEGPPRNGDLDVDGDVDFEDFFLFANAFGRSRGQAGFEDRADIDVDGDVDFEDFFLFATAFGKTG